MKGITTELRTTTTVLAWSGRDTILRT